MTTKAKEKKSDEKAAPKRRGATKSKDLPVNKANAEIAETQSPSTSGLPTAPDNPDEKEQKPLSTTAFKPPNKSPVDGDEVAPVIKAGFWVRLQAAKGVPDHAVGRDAQVTRAGVQHAEGQDEVSPAGYEYQPADALFDVKLRDTGEEFQVTRKAFSAWDNDRVRLGGK